MIAGRSEEVVYPVLPACGGFGNSRLGLSVLVGRRR
jgi:hypothetical protein